MNNTMEQIRKSAEEEGFWGTISAYRNQEKIIDLSFGPRDVANQLPNNSDTRFGTASGTKTFTAVAIGTLIDQGKLELDSAVGDLLEVRDCFTN